MKKLSKLAILFGLILGTISCADYLEIDLDDLGGNSNLGGTSDLTGTWEITSIKTSTFQSMVLQTEQEQSDLGTLTFNSNGSGTYNLTSSDASNEDLGIPGYEDQVSGEFDWFENDDKVIMNILTLTDSLSSDNLAIAWDVVSGGSVSQEWTAGFSYYTELDTDPYGNEVPWTEYLMKYEIRVFLKK